MLPGGPERKKRGPRWWVRGKQPIRMLATLAVARPKPIVDSLRSLSGGTHLYREYTFLRQTCPIRTPRRVRFDMASWFVRVGKRFVASRGSSTRLWRKLYSTSQGRRSSRRRVDSETLERTARPNARADGRLVGHIRVNGEIAGRYRKSLPSVSPRRPRRDHPPRSRTVLRSISHNLARTVGGLPEGTGILPVRIPAA